MTASGCNLCGGKGVYGFAPCRECNGTGIVSDADDVSDDDPCAPEEETYRPSPDSIDQLPPEQKRAYIKVRRA